MGEWKEKPETDIRIRIYMNIHRETGGRNESVAIRLQTMPSRVRKSTPHKRGSRTRANGYKGPTGWKKQRWVRQSQRLVSPPLASPPLVRRRRLRTKTPQVANAAPDAVASSAAVSFAETLVCIASSAAVASVETPEVAVASQTSVASPAAVASVETVEVANASPTCIASPAAVASVETPEDAVASPTSVASVETPEIAVAFPTHIASAVWVESTWVSAPEDFDASELVLSPPSHWE